MEWKDNLKISVVLPVYNCEKYLARAIQSVLNQNYDNWELIIVNDGSQDSSHQIAYEFAGKDNRIHLIDKKNEGVSVARNKGMETVTGDILMFLDADDWFENSAFETVIDNWDASIQMLLFDYYDVPENGKKQYRQHFKEKRIEFKGNGTYIIDELLLYFSGFYSTQTIVHSPWGRAFQSGYIKKKKIEFPEDVYTSEDQIFALRAGIGMQKVCYLSIPIYNYRINTASVTNRMYQKDGERLLSNMKNCNHYVKEIFSGKQDIWYETVYYKYVYEGMKVIFWWLANEADRDKKILGRNYCYEQAITVRQHICKQYSISDRTLLMLCEMKCFGIIDQIVGLRKKVKRWLNIR